MVSNGSMEDLLEMYYGKDRSNWPEIRVIISKDQEISWGAFESFGSTFESLQINTKEQVHYFGAGLWDALEEFYHRD